MISGLAILLLPDPYTRALIALYSLVRAGKVLIDIQESKGRVTETHSTWSIIVLSIVLNLTFVTLYMVAPKIWAESKWQNLHWLFGFTNQPNDRIFRDILRRRLKI